MPDAERPDVHTLDNFIGGRWVKASATEFFDVHNPAVGDVIGRTPLSTGGRRRRGGGRRPRRRFPAWRDTPVNARAQVLYKFKALLEQHFEELARIVTTEHGKTLDEARGSVRRGIECVEVACGAPSLMQGFGLEDISAGIDCHVVRQPLGVVRRDRAVQFSGDGADVVPAVRDRHRQHVRPEAVRAGAAVAAQDGGPAAAVRPAAGRRQHRQRRPRRRRTRSAITRAFAPCRSSARRRSRSTSTSAATHAGKRVQALGGAKNFVVVMPDADLERSIGIISESFYGCAGERCLAGSMLVPVGDAHARGARPDGRGRAGAEGRRRHRSRA